LYRCGASGHVWNSKGTERRELSLLQGAHAAPGRVSFIQTIKPGVLFLVWQFFISCGKTPFGNKMRPTAVYWMSAGVEGKDLDVLDLQERARFEQLVLPHLDAAFNLARWILRGRADAEDVAQEAMLRAFRFFRGFHGGDVRAWLLQIVRNNCYTWLEKNRPMELTAEFDEELYPQTGVTPESLAIAGDNRERLTRALEDLPPRFREVLILRELEGCSYKEIAAITSMPIGTVMSALARARQRLHRTLTQADRTRNQEANREL
jgi:RNA polymerase sigma-70 factor, ECF subfamily